MASEEDKECAEQQSSCDGEETEEQLTSHFNKFKLLDPDSEIDHGSDRDSDQSNQLTESDTDRHSPELHNIINSKKSTSKNRNKRNKIKKKQQKQKSLASLKQIDDDEFMLQSLDSHPQEPLDVKVSGSIVNKIDRHTNLLKIDLRNLNPDAELKRMFGKGVVKDTGIKTRVPVNWQRSRFVSSFNLEAIKYQNGSVPRMELDDLFNDETTTTTSSKKQSNAENPDKIMYFRYVHDLEYQRVQSEFVSAVQQGASEYIIQNSRLYPTHVESLVKLSDMMRISENYKDAADFIELALLTLEKGFHPKFNPATANCRLSYRRPENRTLFITLFKHISCLNRRGLRRTPLEFSKFLLSLDPEKDPLLAVLLLDYFAIRSEQYDFYIEFISKWNHQARLPSFNLSLALIYFMKSRPDKSSKQTKQDCESYLKKANDQLQLALLRYPNFVVHLMDAWSADPEGSLKKCDYFNYTIFGNRYKQVPETVDLLVSIYVQRTAPLWKTKHVMPWLEENLENMVDRFAKKELLDEGLNIEYWSCFQGPVPRNLLRHVILSELNVKLPASVSTVTTLDIDPFPPENIKSYDLKSSSIARSSETTSSSLGIAGLFLRSIMPSFSQATNDDFIAAHEQIAELEGQLPDNQARDIFAGLLNFATNHRARPNQDDDQGHHDN